VVFGGGMMPDNTTLQSGLGTALASASLPREEELKEYGVTDIIAL
jgi:hypothetical protein